MFMVLFHYLMHVLTIILHQGCVATLGSMPTPFLFRSGYWTGTFSIQISDILVEYTLGVGQFCTAKHASFLAVS